MENINKDWRALFQESEQYRFRFIEMYLNFLSSYLSFQSVMERESEQLELEKNVLQSLILIESIQTYLFNRKAMLANQRGDRWNFFIYDDERIVEAAIQLERTLRVTPFKAKSYKRQCERMLKQITSYYKHHSYVIKNNFPPSPPWFAKKEHMIYAKLQ